MKYAIRLKDAAEHGVTRGRLRGRAWEPVSYGLYAPAGAAVDIPGRCRQLWEVLPATAAFSHFTAAQRHDCWLPQLPTWLPVMATLPPGVVRPERSGLYVARSRSRLAPVEGMQGIPFVAPAFAVGQLAADLGVIDLVVAIDSLLHRKACTVEDIIAAIRPRQRGLPRLREALALCDPRSESPWESILRVLHVVGDIPVEAQALIRDEDGAVVARSDLRIKGTRRLPEYDGAGHRDRQQHEDDLLREKDLCRLGWERYGYIAREITGSARLILRDAESALGLPHDPRRADAWLTLASQSSLTPEGRRLLLHRLHRYNRPLRGRATSV